MKEKEGGRKEKERGSKREQEGASYRRCKNVGTGGLEQCRTRRKEGTGI